MSSQSFTCEKKFKSQPLVGKDIAAIFWYSDGVIHMDCFEPETNISTQYYTVIFKNLKYDLQNFRSKKEYFSST